MSLVVRRVLPSEAQAYQRLRIEGLVRHPDCFRIAPEDEAALSSSDVAKKLDGGYVLGGFLDGDLVGIAGLSALPGAKAKHKALLWGMYVREEARGLGLADQLMEGILAEARNRGFEQIQLTVIASNPRAYKVYERWGFKLYGTEIQSVKVGDTYYDEQLRVCFLG